ncbi:MAG: hypothetical protein IJO93_04215 [Clostridia bacterium]|nr:hypothetical protein [Clostridia bacterium]
MPIKDCNRKARANYNAKCEHFSMVLYPSEEDIKKRIAERIEAGEPRATYIKRLIREDIRKEEQKTESN